MKQKLTLYFTQKKQSNEQTNKQTSLLCNTMVCLQNNYCGFQCTNGNLGNQIHVVLIVKLCLNNKYQYINK